MKKSSSLHLLMLFTALIVLIASAGLYTYLYYETGVLTERDVTARGVVAAEQADQVEGKDLQVLYDSTAADRARLPGLFVPADDAVVFIQSIESISAQSGATVSILSISKNSNAAAPAGTIGTITAHISVNGSWTNVMRTLTLFETLPYRSAVNHITMTVSTLSGGKGGGGPTWQLSFDIAASTLVSAKPSQPANP